MATYLHFILTGFSKKKSKAADTHAQDILVNYQEGSLGGYRPTFYFDWIKKKTSKAADAQPQAIRTSLRYFLHKLNLNWIFFYFITFFGVGHKSTSPGALIY